MVRHVGKICEHYLCAHTWYVTMYVYGIVGFISKLSDVFSGNVMSNVIILLCLLHV